MASKGNIGKFERNLGSFARSNSTGIIRKSNGDRGGVYMQRGRIGGDSTWYENRIRNAHSRGLLRGVRLPKGFK